MIFGERLALAILAGRKTVTRRIPKPGEVELWCDGDTTGQRRVSRYQPGRSYAVQSGGGEAVARILVTEVELRPLLEFGHQDARREGFDTERDFFDHWLEVHRTINVDLDVWVISFELEPDHPLFLTPAARPHGSVRGYTRNVHDALEAVPTVPREEQQLISDEARERYDAMHAPEIARREARSLASQLREAQLRALQRGVDVTPEIARIREQLDQIRAKAKGDEAAA